MSRQRVDGVLFIDKPLGISSAAVVARARRCFNAQKGGHTGTLDPLASGLLPVCLGEATKFAADLLDADKGYRATVRLGVTTSTGDAEGTILEARPVSLNADTLEAALARLRGPLRQVPPMHSALKRDGRPLYSYAREGITLAREAREVTIHELVLLERHETTVVLDVGCSKGTYVRVLAEDLGRLLGCGAHLAGLVRTRVGNCSLADAITLDALEAGDSELRRRYLRPVDSLVQDTPRIDLGELEALRFCQGQRLLLADAARLARVRIYGAGDAGRFLGLGEVDDEGVLHPRRVLVPPPPAFETTGH